MLDCAGLFEAFADFRNRVCSRPCAFAPGYEVVPHIVYRAGGGFCQHQHGRRTKSFEGHRSVGDRPSSFTLPAVSQQTRTVAGYVHACFADQTLTIKHCKVDRPHQGRGLGGLLIEAAEKRAQKLGAAISKVKLTVLETNEPARKCYAKSGFQVCGESPSIFPPCNCPEDSCRCDNKIKWLSMEKRVA